MTSDDLYLVFEADLSNKIADASSYFTLKNWFSILGYPDEMVFQVKDSVGGLSIELHTETVYHPVWITKYRALERIA